MPRLPVIALLALVGVLACTPAAPQTPAEIEAAVDALFEELDRPGSPGAAALVVRDGQVAYRGGFGLADIEHDVPITPSTVFDIASVSKQFAGMAIAMLLEDGTIGLHDDIRSHLPDLPDFGRTITVEHLVHHTSGLRDWPGTLALAGWRMDDVISFEQILTMARNQQDLNFEPGAEYSYSNTGYNVLAALVAEVSGQSFRAWTDENIFRPLGMVDTHFHDDHSEIVANRAQGYNPAGGGFEKAGNGLTALGSSSLYTTVDDLAKWMLNFERGDVGGRPVIERMQQRFVLNGGEEIPYAFGQSSGEYRGLRTWTHTGSWAGFRTVLVRFPEQRFGVVVLANFGSYDPGATARAIADIFLAEEMGSAGSGDRTDATADRAPAEAVRVDRAVLDQYVGTYRLGPGWLVAITRDGDGLVAQATGEAAFPMTAASEREFWVEAYGASMTFGRDADGAVDHLVYRNIDARRVDPTRVTAVDVTEYVGEYYSAELDTSYWLRMEGDALMAHHRRHGDIELTPVLVDELEGGAWFMPVVEFDRDAAGAVSGLRVTQGRSRNMRFERR